jgi:hypothetical protein
MRHGNAIWLCEVFENSTAEKRNLGHLVIVPSFNQSSNPSYQGLVTMRLSPKAR